MDLTLNDHRLEIPVDAAAAALLGAAVAFAGSAVADLNAAVVGLAAFVAAFFLLRRVSPGEVAYVLPPLALPDSDAGPDELLLTGEMALSRPAVSNDELILDDVLAELGPESRVVRLFEQRQVPTAGELQAGIDRHLRASRSAFLPPDASQALSDALAELRRSLR